MDISDIPIAPVVSTSFTGAVASFSDGVTPGTISVTINWGDGTSSPGTISSTQEEQPANPGVVEPTQPYTLYVVSGTHTYSSTGNDTVTVSINDGAGDTGSVIESASVGEPPLQITAAPVNASVQTAFSNQTVATFTDPGIAGAGALGPASQYTSQFTASINWGDSTAATTGTITFNATTGVFSVEGSHTYGTTGSYSVTTTVTPQTISVSLIDSSDPTEISLTGSTIDGSATITTTTNSGFADLLPLQGQIITGPGIPAEDQVIAVNSQTDTITISLPATATASGVSLLASQTTKSPSAEFIQELYPDVANQTTAINTLALPTVASTSGNFALTVSAGSPSESRLHLSENGQYLVLGGYNATAASTSDQSYLDSPSTVYRVIGTINGTGTVNTSTALTDADYVDNFRGVVTANGTSFYTYGSGDNLYGVNADPTGFVHYVAPGGVGSAGPSTVITNDDYDTNGAEIFANTLYTAIRTSKTDSYVSGIYAVGTPGTLPTTANQLSTLFIEVPQSNPFDSDSSKTESPYDFFMAELPGNQYNINGVNVAYVADGSSGIARFDYDIIGNESTPQWNFSYYISSTGNINPNDYTIDDDGENDGQLYIAAPYSATNLPPIDTSLAGGITGLTGEVLPNGQVELFAVTAGLGYGNPKNGVPANSVIEVTDSGNTGDFNGANANFTLLATAGSNAEYRGVALSPWASATSTANVETVVPQLVVSTSPTNVSAGSTTSVTITAEDQYNNVLTGFSDSVTLSDSLGGASFSAVSFTSGVATVTATLDTAGTQTITASDSTATIAGTSGAVTVTPAAASKLLVSASPSTRSAGSTTSVTITAEDQYNNVVTGFSDSVTLSDSLTGANFSSASFSGGRATVTATLDKAGTQTITATDATATISGTGGAVTVTPAAASKLLVSTAPSSLSAGSTTSVTITAEDQYNNVVTGFGDSVTLSDNLAGASFSAVSFTNGTATVTATLDKAGTQTLTASDSTATIAGTSGPVTVTPAAASKLLVATVPSALSAGSTTNISITAEDQYNNVVTGFSDSVTLSDSLTGASFGSVSFSGGTATVTGTLDKAGTQTITASDSAATISGTGGAVTVTPAAASKLLVSAAPSSLSAGSTTSVTITSEDQYNNVVTSFGDSVTLSDSLGGLSFSAVSFSGGKATVTATLDKAGTQSITASDTAATIAGSSGPVTVTPAAASKLMLSTSPANPTAGSASSVTITAEDQFNNVVTSFSDSVTLSDSLGGASFAGVSFSGGEATVTATLDKAGTQTHHGQRLGGHDRRHKWCGHGHSGRRQQAAGLGGAEQSLRRQHDQRVDHRRRSVQQRRHQLQRLRNPFR